MSITLLLPKRSWHLRTLALLTLGVFALASPLLAHDPEFSSDLGRDGCTFATTGSHPYFPLWPGYSLAFEGEELDDEDELVEVSAIITVLSATEMVDGILTRVVEEVEMEDGELVEISRNFFAQCRETGAVWYFGEDVDDYEDGEIVGHSGVWRAGVDGAQAGIQLPGTPLIGARYFQEIAPGIAEDQAEIVSLDETLTVPAGTFDDVLKVVEGSGLDPEDFSEKWYVQGIGLIKDDPLDLVSITLPPCMPDTTTHCLQNGRFRVEAKWQTDTDAGDATAILASGLSGEFWFFNPANTELIVKVLDACDDPDFNSFWVFAAGLTNVDVTLTVTDTATNTSREYRNDLGENFQAVLDTAAFSACP